MNKNERNILSSEFLRTFVAIADCGNLTVAAERLHRTQSAISVQLRKLEENLCVTLFERTPKGMVLSDAGIKLLPKARHILAELKQTSGLFENPLKGQVRLGIPDDFNDVMLEHILTEFAFAHPGVQVEAVSGCTSRYPAAVNDDEMDIAVCTNLNDDVGEPLSKEKIVWAAKKGIRITDDKQVSLAILDRSCWWRDLPIDALNSIGRDYKIAFRSSNFSSLRAAIQAGFAIGILPASTVGENMIVLSKADGFPELPISRRSILVGDNISKILAGAMIEAIKNAEAMPN